MPYPSLIPANWQLPEPLRNRLGTTAGRQRIIIEGNSLLVVGHEPPLADEDGRRGVLFWLDDRDEWRASNGEPGKVAIGNLLDRYNQKLEEFDLAESKASRADDYLYLLEGLAPLVRAARNFSGVMDEARKARPNDRMLIDQRDRAYETARRGELQYDDAKNAMDVAVIRRAEEQAIAAHQMAISSHRLNRLAAAFFPIATLGAIFGTTLTDEWSWAKSSLPFMLFLLTGTLAGIALMAFINRPEKR
jgi:hypothetical protein